jgi:hypothetical protein
VRATPRATGDVRERQSARHDYALEFNVDRRGVASVASRRAGVAIGAHTQTRGRIETRVRTMSCDVANVRRGVWPRARAGDLAQIVFDELF